MNKMINKLKKRNKMKTMNIAEILKDCPKGTKLYSPLFGEVELDHVLSGSTFSIYVRGDNMDCAFTAEGKYFEDKPNSECLLFPSKDQRDWMKFKMKKEKFNPHTFKPFDKVLIWQDLAWGVDFFSRLVKDNRVNVVGYSSVKEVIPYNDDTKHLVGTTDDCPEYYKWWETDRKIDSRCHNCLIPSFFQRKFVSLGE